MTFELLRREIIFGHHHTHTGDRHLVTSLDEQPRVA